MFLLTVLKPSFAPAMALVPPPLVSGRRRRRYGRTVRIRSAAGFPGMGSSSNGVIGVSVSIGGEGEGVHCRHTVGVCANLVQRPASGRADVVGPSRAFGDAGADSSAGARGTGRVDKIEGDRSVPASDNAEAWTSLIGGGNAYLEQGGERQNVGQAKHRCKQRRPTTARTLFQPYGGRRQRAATAAMLPCPASAPERQHGSISADHRHCSNNASTGSTCSHLR